MTSTNFTGSVPENYDKGLGPYVFEPFAKDLARRVAGFDANEVLELAAGTGIVTRQLRDALPASARLVATDLNAPMLEIAQTKFAIKEAVKFQPADAMDLPFEDESFDLIVSQFGVMFFPDKPASFREARRVLRPGGTYLFNAWSSMSDNSFSEITYAAGEHFFPDDPPQFYKVPFSYPDIDTAYADLAAGGFEDISHETIDFEKEVDNWGLFARGLVLGNPFGEEIENRPGVEASEVIDAIIVALIDAFGENPGLMPLKATVFNATK